MRLSESVFSVFLTVLCACSPLCFGEDTPSEEQKRTIFRAQYNQHRAEKRLAAIGILDDSKEQRSIETLYFVSFRDPDPEVRSRAFSALVYCEDEYGYTAHLAADSFRQEKEFGVKVEKAVAMGRLQYKWAALNELVEFLSTLRWNYWNWHTYNNHGGYIASGTPPEPPPAPVSGSESDVKRVDEKKNDEKKIAAGNEGYDRWRNREPLRWRNENELMGLIAGTINRMTGTQIESRPRIDQEIVKWWDRKSELWVEYDRKMRTDRLPKWKDIQFKTPIAPSEDGIVAGKDTLRDLLDAKEEKPVTAKKVRGVDVEDE